MRRQGQYADSGVNSYAAAQMQQMSAQRMQHNPAMNHFPGRPDALPKEEEHPYMSSKAGGQWQWDRDGPKASDPMSSHLYNEGQGDDASRSFYQGQRSDPKLGLEKQANIDSRGQLLEQDMEVGYEDNPLPQTFEALEQKFNDEIMKLTKEQNDAEDAENARHRERTSEINSQYQEKLTSLRARHASRRDEFLRRESQARQQQYQQAGMSHYQNNTGPSDPQGYGGSVAAAGEPHGSYGMGQFDSYRERAQLLGGTRGHGFESRGPYPGGRAYNTGGRYY
ncbi:PREDICTED: uncharacterized protein LOC104601440 [Nelumbo nucifera]|uniref:Uncharacterized protein LOC104601440 n=2 Tax=Nelumbo nucifera TaxID=4432 RepID=A0A1U8AL53_NELNU|nr:PREDICTED: uncharacterized protein LOC104601440 [Nelumbo nucifera]XP_010263066.1 PREDICTED: uncharacterized protein LOC104601440 [Nelumbo nucifera]DAD29003.1 TPA_asm: hypothetical protein HUJ06_030471 [Nelumbo nucifera]